jgi:hypothetical protein
MGGIEAPVEPMEVRGGSTGISLGNKMNGTIYW